MVSEPDFGKSCVSASQPTALLVRPRANRMLRAVSLYLCFPRYTVATSEIVKPKKVQIRGCRSD